MHSEIGPVSYIRRRMSQLRPGGLFCTREFLHLNIARATLDTTLYRMVKNREIQRVAFGVFRETSDLPFPSGDAIRAIKDVAFARKSFSGGRESAVAFGFEQESDIPPTFVTNGCSTSFRTVSGAVKLKHASARKVQEGDSFIGMLIRAFHYLGKFRVKNESVKPPEPLGRKERKQLRSLASLMPAYMSDSFVKPVERVKSGIDWNRLEREYYPYLSERGSPDATPGRGVLDWLSRLESLWNSNNAEPDHA